MLKAVAKIFASRLQLSIASLQTSTFQVSNSTTGAAMSIKHKSDVENHLSIRPKRNLIHLVAASQPDATDDSVGEMDHANVIAQDADTHAALQPICEPTPFGASTSPDNSFGASIVEAPKA
jgi:acyl CoA:acetate/3-ketoacid CoA transferase